MKSQLHHLIACLGARSYLIQTLLWSFGGLLCWRLIRFVLKTEGFANIEDVTPEQAAWLMASLIGLTLLILGRRLLAVNHTIRKTVMRKYREALEQNDPKAEQKVRRLVDDLNIRGTVFHRLNGLIRLVPEPFVMLVGLLGGTCVLILLAFFWLHPYAQNKNGGFLGHVLFPNCPWAIATFVFAWLVFNDIWVLEEMERLVMSITVLPSPGYDEHLERFQELLSPSELAVFQKRFLEHPQPRLQEIADTLYISVSTVKTHINHIYKKMRDYDRENKLREPLQSSVKWRSAATQAFA